MRSLYRQCNVNGKMTTVHRAVFGDIPEGMEIDHKDQNKRNDDPTNLRLCTHGQNMMNRGKLRHNTSGYKGVSRADAGRWRARLTANGVTYATFHNNKEDAATAYNFLAAKHHGEFAHYNKPIEV